MFDKGIKKNSKNDYKPHVFSDIEVTALPDGKTTINSRSGFKRLKFKKNDGLHTDISYESIVYAGNSDASTKQGTDKIKKEAYSLGFSEGEKTGRDSEKIILEPVLQNYHQSLDELEKVKRNLYLNAEEKTVNLALSIAKKIICSEVSTNKEVVVNVVKEALKKVSKNEKVNIKLSTSDYKHMDCLKTGQKNPVNRYEGITFEEDKTITSGGCIIETNSGEIDARLDKQIDVIKEVFASEMKKTLNGG